MKSSTSRDLQIATRILLFVLVVAAPAFAGPPLVCHRLDIGDAKSLPWSGSSWNVAGNDDYNTKNLAQDTLAILDSGAPVIVRMETLRRATLYARKDPRAAKDLLTRLYHRASESGADPSALFDAGYLVETYKQWFGKEPNPAFGIDGYAMVVRALAIRGHSDPEMEFAAALITLHGPARAHQEYARKAIAGAKDDPLLARNLSAQFLGNETQTVSQALAVNIHPDGAQK